MKRNILLGLLTLFGAVAVGFLLLLSGGGLGGVRAEGSGGRAARRDSRAPESSGRKGHVQEVTPGQARLAAKAPAMVVQPGLREPFDSPETVEARERYAGQIEDLIRKFIDPQMKPHEKNAVARDLEALLRLMGHRVSPETRDRLLQILAETPGHNAKLAVAGAIGSLDGDVDTAKALLGMLEKTPDDIDTRRAVLSALGQMNVHEVTPVLLSMLGQGIQDEAQIIRTIGQLARPDELEQLFLRLDKPLVATSRTEIERVLQERGRVPGLYDKVAAALDGADVQKRRSLLRILSASKEPGHAEKVRELLGRETDAESRALAIQALGRYGDVDSGKALLDIVQSGPPEDQYRAITAIQAIHDRDTIGVLAGNWGQLGGEARIAVMGAMSRVPAPTPEMVKIAQEEGLEDREMRVRTAAARVLGQRGRDEGVDPLVTFIGRSTTRGEWATAFNSLENIHTNKAANAAIGALRVVPDGRERQRLEERFRKIADETK